MKKKKGKYISAKKFDKIFDEGKEDITPYLDLSSIRRPNRETQRVNVDFPGWMVNSMDKEAHRLGITRQSLIKTWLAERLDR
jgi:hypothetical protein